MHLRVATPVYTRAMDKVRLGRILGAGARHAARTAVQAVDAATAADPNPPAARPLSQRPSPTPHQIFDALTQTARAVDQGKQAARTAVKTAALAPLKRASKVLWLEITGSFFLLFALPFVGYAYKTRDGIHTASPEHAHFLLYCGLAALFAYFSASSFLRARRM